VHHAMDFDRELGIELLGAGLEDSAHRPRDGLIPRAPNPVGRERNPPARPALGAEWRTLTTD
jgi:hypothetical protein